MNTYDDKWEEQINALLDGELSNEDAELLKTEANDDRELAKAIIEAYQLQKVMDTIQVERAPASLRKKLNAIPRQQEPAFSFGMLRNVLQPRWVTALAVVPLVMISVSLMQPDTPSLKEIEQARQDLALAFAYIDKAGQFTGREIESTIGNTMTDAIAVSVIRNIQSQNETSKEKEV